jgi:Domain of unknown function (DUF4287)
MRRFDRGGRRKTNNTPQDAQARPNWKTSGGGGRPGAKTGGRHRSGGARGGAPASVVEKSAAMHLRERTGRTLEEWVKLVQETGPATRKERAEWLKTKHGLGVNFAAWIALSAEEQLEARAEGTNGHGPNGADPASGNGSNGRHDAAGDDVDGEDDSEDE